MRDRYKIVRMYSDDRGSVTVLRGLTLEQAQQHCRNDQTRGILPDGVRWFDGYDHDKRTR